MVAERGRADRVHPQLLVEDRSGQLDELGRGHDDCSRVRTVSVKRRHAARSSASGTRPRARAATTNGEQQVADLDVWPGRRPASHRNLDG